MVKVTQKHEDCIGCGACVAIDPENWEMRDGRAILISGELKNGLYEKMVNSVGNSRDAANSCPTQCIKVEE